MVFLVITTHSSIFYGASHADRNPTEFENNYSKIRNSESSIIVLDKGPHKQKTVWNVCATSINNEIQLEIKSSTSQATYVLRDENQQIIEGRSVTLSIIGGDKCELSVDRVNYLIKLKETQRRSDFNRIQLKDPELLDPDSKTNTVIREHMLKSIRNKSPKNSNQN